MRLCAFLFPKQAVTRVGVGKDDDESIQQAANYIRSNKPAFLVAYMDDTDGAGHDNGWGTNFIAQR